MDDLNDNYEPLIPSDFTSARFFRLRSQSAAINASITTVNVAPFGERDARSGRASSRTLRADAALHFPGDSPTLVTS